MTLSFDRVADIYDETRALTPEVAQQVTTCLVRLSRATAETRFFEPGIGTGRIALPLVERGYDYTGVDISDAMMAKLRQKVEGKSHRLRLVNADVTNLPFDDNVFDVAIAPHILHLIPDWRQALAEIRRVLKLGGIFIYFHHPTHRSGTQDQVSQQWQQILSGYGYHSDFPGGVTEDVLDHLQQQGAELEHVTVAEVDRSRTVAEILQTYCDRIYSNLWRVPDDIYPQALAGLQEWVQQHFPDRNQTIVSGYEVTLTAAHGWTE